MVNRDEWYEHNEFLDGMTCQEASDRFEAIHGYQLHTKEHIAHADGVRARMLMERDARRKERTYTSKQVQAMTKDEYQAARKGLGIVQPEDRSNEEIKCIGCQHPTYWTPGQRCATCDELWHISLEINKRKTDRERIIEAAESIKKPLIQVMWGLIKDWAWFMTRTPIGFALTIGITFCLTLALFGG